MAGIFIFPDPCLGKRLTELRCVSKWMSRFVSWRMSGSEFGSVSRSLYGWYLGGGRFDVLLNESLIMSR